MNGQTLDILSAAGMFVLAVLRASRNIQLDRPIVAAVFAAGALFLAVVLIAMLSGRMLTQ